MNDFNIWIYIVYHLLGIIIDYKDTLKVQLGKINDESLLKLVHQRILTAITIFCDDMRNLRTKQLNVDWRPLMKTRLSS